MKPVIHLTEDQVEHAYQSLLDSDRAVIDLAAEQIEAAVKGRKAESKKGPAMFARKSALELLSKTGIFLFQKHQRDGSN